jgi:hypothetical protein
MTHTQLYYLTGLFAALCLGHLTPTWAASSVESGFPNIQLVETEDSDCALKDGNMMSISNSQPGQPVEVWVDRWFMNVQTADHTKHTFNHSNDLIPLGCTNTVSGKQHWTIHSVKILPN